MINLSLKYKKKNNLALESNIISKINKNDILIKVHSCGICGSDLKILKGGSNRVKKNVVLGHEISGEIIYSSANKKFKKGQNIILGADIPNKKNKDFAFGHEIDGGFQKYLTVKHEILQASPYYLTSQKIDHEVTCLTEPLACCINGIEKINLKPNENVIIFGAGSIGNMISKLCILKGSKNVFLVDTNISKTKNQNKLKKIHKLSFKNYKQKIFSILKNKNTIKYCFVACSSPLAQNEALKITSKNGSVNFFAGLRRQKGKDPIVELNTNLIHYKQLKIVGSHGSEKKHIIKAAQLIINKKILLKDIISHVYSLKQANEAFKRLKSGNCTKIIIKP